jgi:hypothetical protein
VSDDQISCRLDWGSAPQGLPILLAWTWAGGVAAITDSA